MVIPWRTGSPWCPTKLIHSGSSTFPSTCVPPIGFGRSRTMTSVPVFAATSMQNFIV